MDHLPAEIVIRIFDKSRLSDQLISHRLITNKFRSFIPTAASRIQRVDTTDLVAVSKKLAVFSQKDCAYYNCRNYLHEEPEIERAYANLLLYFCNLSGDSLKCISFTAPLYLGSATMEKLALLCPNIIEINVGSDDTRLQYFGGEVQLLFNYVYLALPRFSQLKILRIIADIDMNTAWLQPIVARLRLQKLRTTGDEAPLLTADPSLLEELVVHELSGGPYQENENRIYAVFPNLRRHYFKSKKLYATDYIPPPPGEAQANYRRLHMLRGSSWIGGRNLRFIDQRLFLDFPYLQSMNVVISDDESCDRFIRALQSSRNWRALNMDVIPGRVSNEKCIQLLQALFYTTAVRLKSLTLKAGLELDHTFVEQFLHFDQAGSTVVFDKTLRKCKVRGLGMLLLVAKVASACSRLKSLNVTDFANYMQSVSRRLELHRTALAHFEQANLRSLVKLTLDVAHSIAYHIIQRLRGSRLHTLQLFFTEMDRNISADACCSSLLCEDKFPYLRKIEIAVPNESMLWDMMSNIVRNLPGLQWFKLALSSKCMGPKVQLDQAVWQHIADHANLQFCYIRSHYNICSRDTVSSLCNDVIARKKVDENGRMLPWLYMEFDRWYRESSCDQHHMGQNAFGFYGF